MASSASLATKSSTPKVVPFASSSRSGICKYSAVGVLFVALVVLINVCQGQVVNLADNIELAKKTVAPVVCLVRDAATGNQVLRFRILGTAFMEDKNGTFITASHVIADFNNTEPWKSSCKAAITFPIGGWVRNRSADVRWFSFDSGACQVNTDADVAICRTDNDLSKEAEIHYELSSISDTKPRDGTTIFFTGFPLQATDPITSIGAVAGFAAEGDYQTVLIDKNAWPGASGSPIYLSDGKTVVGMILRTGTGDAIGLSFGVSGDKIKQILTEAERNWSEQEKKKQTSASQAQPK
jgi:S1-C subfamily serine protease